MNIKVGKSKTSLKKHKLMNLSFRLKGILPVLIMLQDIDSKSPEVVLDCIATLTDHESYKKLNRVELGILKDYLYRWGCNDFTQEG